MSAPLTPGDMPGGVPTFNPNPSKGLQPLLIALLYLFPGIAGLIVAVRIVKKRVDRTLGGDVLEMRSGYHDEDVNFLAIDWVRANKVRPTTLTAHKPNASNNSQLQFALGAEYNPVVCLVKMSFLWSLQKLRSPNKWIKRSLWAIQIINVIYMIVSTTIALVPCLPLRKKWHPDIAGHCMDGPKYILGNVTVVLITDALVLLMPSWIIWDLQMPLKRKIMTISFLSFGLVLIAVGIARMIWLYNAFLGKSKSYSVEPAYSAIESSIAIVGACGPTMKYILGLCVPSLKSASANSKRPGYGSSSHQLSVTKRSGTGRSRKPTDGYDDLDTFEANAERYEMKSEWKWGSKNDEDARSDEQEITRDVNDAHGGIVKSVEWSVSSRGEGDERRDERRRSNKSRTDVRAAVEPTDVV
ncbi:uncharacterized protein N0V89_011992 [Didymosphaeria variabile]|uniref:Rhodopsin domain-containing protein n=1 Tax=Didymosphaeria variabile TaxID=1932322 RepID=A0A9W9C5V3_9PLEO|nr:uncharacterized protein N0V89_011992 [Didymosphaeria variabile]KAJ4345857.1 hypothetical protein N0V89_011992 [Didymosphaeria variabile]